MIIPALFLWEDVSKPRSPGEANQLNTCWGAWGRWECCSAYVKDFRGCSFLRLHAIWPYLCYGYGHLSVDIKWTGKPHRSRKTDPSFQQGGLFVISSACRLLILFIWKFPCCNMANVITGGSPQWCYWCCFCPWQWLHPIRGSKMWHCGTLWVWNPGHRADDPNSPEHDWALHGGAAQLHWI